MKDLRAYILSRSAVNPLTGCRVWKLSVGSHGYGNACWRPLSSNAQGVVTAHRLAWQAWRGPIHKGMHVLHRCDNRRCVNPKHLFLGTDKDNFDDKIAKGRAGYGETHRRAVIDALQRNGRASLTPEQVRKIRRAIGRHADIAAKYGIHRGTVGHVKRRTSYRWVK